MPANAYKMIFFCSINTISNYTSHDFKNALETKLFHHDFAV